MIPQWKKTQSISDINKVEISNDFNFFLLTENQNVLEKLQEKTLRGDHVFRSRAKCAVKPTIYFSNQESRNFFN